MTVEPSAGVEAAEPETDGWPVGLAGVTETIVATRGPDGDWNQAALGIEPDDAASIETGDTSAALAHTFGRTRTRRNFTAGRAAYVQFTIDPVDVVEAALGVFETDEPILEATGAWTRVEPVEQSRRTERGTSIVDWSLTPRGTKVRERSVPTLSRARGAVVEATIAASRLDVEGYDDGVLRERLHRLETIVERTADARTRGAFDRIDDLAGWRRRES